MKCINTNGKFLNWRSGLAEGYVMWHCTGPLDIISRLGSATDKMHCVGKIQTTLMHGPTNSPECKSYLKIPGVRRVTRNTVHVEDPQI